MNTLLIAEHNNETLADATVNPPPLPRKWAASCTCWLPVQIVAPWAKPPQKLDGVAKVLVADDALYEKQLAEPWPHW